MALRTLLDRIMGNPTQVSPQELEFRRFSEAGDEARRNGQPELALQKYEEGLALAKSTGNQHGQEVFLGQIGALHTEQGRHEEARQALDGALNLANQSGQDFRRARAMLNLGAFHLTREDFPQAQQLLEEALALSRKANDGVTTGLALGNLADLYLKQSNPAYALRLLKDAAPNMAQNSPQAAYLLGRMGQAHLAVGEIDRGRKTLVQAIRVAEENNRPDHELLWSVTLADQLCQDGQYAEALRLYQRAESLTAQRGTSNLPKDFALRMLVNQGVAYYRLGDNEKALDFTSRALEQARAEGNSGLEAGSLADLADVQRALGHPDEAITALKAAIALYNDPTKNTLERSAALVALGNLYQDKGLTDQALDTFEQALGGTDDQDPAGRATALRRIGGILHKHGNFQAALEKWAEALNLFEAAGDLAQAARLLCDIGGVRRYLSGINSALPDYERATMLLNSVRDPHTRGLVLSNVANLYTDLGEVETASSFYQESIHLARQQANRRAESLRLGNFGWFYTMTGRPQEGVRLLDEALATSRQLNDDLLVAVQTHNLAQAHHDLKDYPRAEALARQAIALAEKTGEARWGAMFRANLARTLLAQSRMEEAISLLEQVLPVSRAAADQETLARALARLGEAYLHQGRLEQADSAAREAETVSRKWGYRKGQADALVVRAGVARAQNDSETNLRHLREAKKLYTILHDPLAAELAKTIGDE